MSISNARKVVFFVGIMAFVFSLYMNILMTPFEGSATTIVFIITCLVETGLLKWFYESLKRKQTTKEIAKMLLIPIFAGIVLGGIKIIHNNNAIALRENPPSSDIRMRLYYTSDFVSNSHYINGSTTEDRISIYIDGKEQKINSIIHVDDPKHTYLLKAVVSAKFQVNGEYYGNLSGNTDATFQFTPEFFAKGCTVTLEVPVNGVSSVYANVKLVFFRYFTFWEIVFGNKIFDWLYVLVMGVFLVAVLLKWKQFATNKNHEKKQICDGNSSIVPNKRE